MVQVQQESAEVFFQIRVGGDVVFDAREDGFVARQQGVDEDAFVEVAADLPLFVARVVGGVLGFEGGLDVGEEVAAFAAGDLEGGGA